MTTVQKSMRIPEEMIEGIQGIAQQWGKDFSTVAKELLEEAIRMHCCPGIVFSEGATGRKARIAGTGMRCGRLLQFSRVLGRTSPVCAKPCTGSLSCSLEQL